MSKFKVGDTVMIRYWDDMAREYGEDKRGNIQMRYCMFPQESKEHCGRMASITEILDDEYIRLKMLDEELPTRDNAEGIIWKDEALVLVKASAELTLEEKIDVILEKAKKAILWELS